MEGLTIGRLAREAGVNVETVRYYHRIGLLEEPPRPSGSYRHYPLEAVARLRFIRRAQGLGFSLAEIRELLALGEEACDDVRRRAEAKLKQVEVQIQDLEKLRALLRDLVQRCEAGSNARGCPIVQSLADAPPGVSTPTSKA